MESLSAASRQSHFGQEKHEVETCPAERENIIHNHILSVAHEFQDHRYKDVHAEKLKYIRPQHVHREKCIEMAKIVGCWSLKKRIVAMERRAHSAYNTS